MAEGFLRLTRKWPESVTVATVRDIDAVSRKKHRLACRRINQCFLNSSARYQYLPTGYGGETLSLLSQAV